MLKNWDQILEYRKCVSNTCGHLIIYVNQSGCPLFQRHMVHKLCWVCDEKRSFDKENMAHSLYMRNSVLHIILYLMCLCVQPVYHASSRVVRGWCRYRAGWVWDKTVVCILVQPSHFIANAQPVSETTIYWFCYYRYSLVMLRTQHCDVNLHSRIAHPLGRSVCSHMECNVQRLQGLYLLLCS